ncbi:MAG: family 20 glycosylhydrolase [Bacteroidales bacterium]|nr:family 20 glycosylhydrolase [Bacteroidales bacterium]
MRSLAIMAYLFLALASYALAAGTVPAGQEPKSVEARKGSFNAAGKGFYLDPRLDSLSQTSIASLAGRLSLVSGKISTVVTGISASATPPDKGLVFLLDQSQPSEAFEVDVTPSRMLVKASDARGFIYALQAVKQMMPPEVSEKTAKALPRILVPCALVKDWQDEAERPHEIDCVSQWIEPSALRDSLAHMVTARKNVLIWRLRDEEKWAEALASDPELAEKWAYAAFSGNASRRGDFYTDEQIGEILRAAKSYGIEVYQLIY